MLLLFNHPSHGKLLKNCVVLLVLFFLYLTHTSPTPQNVPLTGVDSGYCWHDAVVQEIPRQRHSSAKPAEAPAGGPGRRDRSDGQHGTAVDEVWARLSLALFSELCFCLFKSKSPFLFYCLNSVWFSFPFTNRLFTEITASLLLSLRNTPWCLLNFSHPQTESVPLHLSVIIAKLFHCRHSWCRFSFPQLK